MTNANPDDRIVSVNKNSLLPPSSLINAWQGLFGGGGGSAGEVHDFSNLSTWSGSHSVGRLPDIAVYLSTGEKVLTDTDATTTTFSVTFAGPQSGFVVLS